jgi:hypothetical protein
MWWTSLLKSIRTRHDRRLRKTSGRRPSFGPAIEALEIRSLLSVSFQAGSVLPAGGGSVVLATGDFNRDGALDLATVNGADSVGIRLGNGNGTLGEVTSYSGGLNLTSVAAADFNGDGRLDLIAGDAQGGTVQLLRGNGDGTFQTPLAFGAGPSMGPLAVGDFNADGHPDLAAVNEDGTNSISVLLNDSSGGFQAPVIYAFDPGSNDGPVALAVGDFNGDHKQDIAVANHSTASVSILTGDGSGGFQAAGNYYVTNLNEIVDTLPEALVVGDFNADGKADLATAGDGIVSVLLGNGDATFQAATKFVTDVSMHSLAVGDFNLDGRQDLAAGFGITHLVGIDGYSADGGPVVYTTYAGTAVMGVTILEGRGDGTFNNGTDLVTDQQAGFFDSESGPQYMDSYDQYVLSLAVGDFDRNGAPDLVLGDNMGYVSTAFSNGAVPPAQLSVSGASVKEGNSGTSSAVFTVTLSAASSAPVTVHYATADGTANTGSDYQALSGTLTFAPGETSKAIAVQVIGDRRAEANETFSVNLDSATGAGIQTGSAQGTIVDDEPRITISDVAKLEGRKGQKTEFVFTVTLSAAYDQTVTMSFRTVNGTATTADNDYVAKTGTLTFNPGETSKTITITVNGDSKKEADETFSLELFGNSSNSLVTKNRGLGTILNDD